MDLFLLQVRSPHVLTARDPQEQERMEPTEQQAAGQASAAEREKDDVPDGRGFKWKPSSWNNTTSCSHKGC